MAIIGVKEITFAVKDLELCARFWSEFGLQQTARGDDRVVLETPEGSRVVLCLPDVPGLPAAPVADPTARRITWGATSTDDLDQLAQRLRERGFPFTYADGVVSGSDPSGYGFALELWQKKLIEQADTRFNAPGAPSRVNSPAPAYDRAAPAHLAHVVLLSPDLDPMIDFYGSVFGFKVSDSYPGFSCFFRCPGAQDHHNLYLLKRGDAIGFHHIAFDLRDMHELFGGGLFMQGRGWKTHLGPGRHPTSSAYFWYFVNPCGGAAEYDFDADVLTDDWTPREMVPSAELFAEWALPGGIERYRGEQKTFAKE